MQRILGVVFISVTFAMGCSIEQGSPDSGDQTGNFGDTTGEQGPAGPAGSAGPAGALQWRDATGAHVQGAVMTGTLTGLLFIDDDGRIWNLDPETATVDVATSLPVRWTNGNCTGAPFVAAPPPRFTFRVAGDQSVRVRPDSAVAYDVTVASVSTDAGCAALAQPATERLVVLPAVAGIEIPILPFAAPLHPERP